MNLRKWYRIFYRVFNRKLNPLKYAQKIGVNFAGGQVYTSMAMLNGALNLGL